MLASLFRGGSGGRSNQYIDSVTDDAHTRSLLFGQSQHVLNLSTSPPPSPFGAPSPRPSNFDDQGGLELEEKDIRVLLAQDAHGDLERPLLLYDSRKSAEVTSPGGKSQPTPRSPLPTTWQAGSGRTNAAKEETGRNRSSTFSGSQSSWSKAARNVRSQDDPFLHCMFGVKYFKRTDTSTKLHIIPAKNRRGADSSSLPRAASRLLEQRRRAPLARAHTSGETPILPALDSEDRDCLLITRLFQVTLDEGSKVVVQPKAGQASAPEKPPKLVEAKLPQYAIGFVLQLPNARNRPRSSGSKYQSLNSTQSLRSAASSYGSEMQSSWTFLDAIPTSLSNSINAMDEDDRRLDMIVDNWDVILRTMGYLERKAARVLKEHLEMILRVVIEQQEKIPKEKSMQRTNQRMIGIQDASFTANHPALIAASADVARRIAYALRIPRVITGTGIVAGHWVDEARMLYRNAGGKQQNFFLFNLLTAFLGNHIQWLERLAPEWYRYRLQTVNLPSNESNLLVSRTIIVSEQKGLARRLVYILASFLPGSTGLDGLAISPQQARLALSLSPPGQYGSRVQSRRSSKPFLLRPQPSSDSCQVPLSTSASSAGSQTSTLANRSPRKMLSRKFSNTIQVKPDRIESELKTGAGTTSSIMPQALDTPTAYIHNLRDSYFPESAIIETNDSVASVDLSKVLHRASSSHRRTSSVSSRWGSFVSGISEIWSKPSVAGDRSSGTTASNGISPKRPQVRPVAVVPSEARANRLEMMVDELDQQAAPKRKQSIQTVGHSIFSQQDGPERPQVNPPRLHVNDKDGVVDVELDLPNFFSAADILDAETEPPRLRKRSTGFTQDGLESMCSFRSLSAHGEASATFQRVNVGGYLRRHHEDFTLHAVRPYDNLIADVKRTMYQEPTPRDALEKILQGQASNTWVNVCTTLVADTKTLSVRRLTLRRQYQVRHSGSVSSCEGPVALSTSTATIIAQTEEIVDETVMAFDTTLADAIEKVLNVGSAESTTSANTTRTHSRAVSTSSTKAVPAANMDGSTDGLRSDKVKVEQRDIVLEALEDVVNSVSDVLNQPHSANKPRKGNADIPQQENNFLRQGVREWMLNVQHGSVW